MHESLTALPIGTAHPDLFRVRRLYESAFPANERRPFEALLSGFDGQGELLAFYLGDCFAGFVSLLSWADITHILYFAIEEAQRNRGLGLRRAGMHQGPQAGPAADCRSGSPAPRGPKPRAAPSPMGVYQRAGFVPSGVGYRWQGKATS